MTHAQHISLHNQTNHPQLSEFEASLPELTLGDRIYACQAINEGDDEMAFAKLFVLYLSGEREIVNEVRRIFGWTNVPHKAHFLVEQLHVPEQKIVFAALELIGVLRSTITVPFLRDIFTTEDPDLAKKIINTLGVMQDSLAIKTISEALKSDHDDIVFHALAVLSRRTRDVSWKTFRKALRHENNDIRREAAFAIASRKNPRSAQCLADVIERETDRTTRLALIQYSGIVPGKALLLPLLKITAHDTDNRARLTASRALYRIQGALSSKALFNLRQVKDPDIHAEVISRLGQYGVEEDKQKRFIRETLVKSDDIKITHSCIEALGYISERQDIDLLMEYLKRDPLTGYGAALALTHIWRLQDNTQAITALKESTSAMQRQVFLKFFIHRRGFGIEPKRLFEAVKWVHENDENINVHYLCALLLQFAPAIEAIEYLMALYASSTNIFEKEAIGISLGNLILHHGDLAIEFMRGHDVGHSCNLMQFIPSGKDREFYNGLTTSMFDTKIHTFTPETLKQACNSVYSALMFNPPAMKQFLHVVPDTPWQTAFVKSFAKHATLDIVRHAKDELIFLLTIDDDYIRELVLSMLKELKDPAIVPSCMMIAESGGEGKSVPLAQNIIKTYAQEGVV